MEGLNFLNIFSSRGLKIQLCIGLVIFLTADLIAAGLSSIVIDTIRPLKVYIPVLTYKSKIGIKYLVLTNSGLVRSLGLLIIGGFLDNFFPAIMQKLFRDPIQ